MSESLSSQNSDLFSFFESTGDILITVTPQFDRVGSKHERSIFIWLYQIKIENRSSTSIRINLCEWEVFSINGIRRVIKTNGIMGKRPVIDSMNFLEYTAQIKLTDSSALVVGHCDCTDMSSDERLIVRIPSFPLDVNNREPVMH